MLYFAEVEDLENETALGRPPVYEMGLVVPVLEMALVQVTLAQMVLVEASGVEAALEVAEGDLAKGMDLAVTLQGALGKRIEMVLVVASGKTTSAMASVVVLVAVVLVVKDLMMVSVETRRIQVSDVMCYIDSSFHIVRVPLCSDFVADHDISELAFSYKVRLKVHKNITFLMFIFTKVRSSAVTVLQQVRSV